MLYKAIIFDRICESSKPAFRRSRDLTFDVIVDQSMNVMLFDLVP